MSATPVGVVGLGTMGAGIAVSALLARREAVVCEVGTRELEAGLSRITAFLEGSVRRGKLQTADRDAMLDRIVPTTDLRELADCGVIVEAVPEDLAQKIELLGRLDDACGPEPVLASNTSTLSVTSIASRSRWPERVVGTHFCNPAPLMKLVEVARGRRTSAHTYERTLQFVADIGKVAVTTDDTPGFVVNLFLVPFENDCIRALEAQRGTVESIDAAVRRGLGHPMGPFTLLDVVGLDIHRTVSLSLFEQLRDRRFAPPPLLDRMVAAGDLGRKTGRGFYTYDASGTFGA